MSLFELIHRIRIVCQMKIVYVEEVQKYE